MRDTGWAEAMIGGMRENGRRKRKSELGIGRAAPAGDCAVLAPVLPGGKLLGGFAFTGASSASQCCG